MNNDKDIIVAVRLLDIPRSIDKEYCYLADSGSCAGTLAVVPFGRANKLVTAIIIRASSAEKTDKQLKRIDSLLNYPVRLTQELIELCGFVADRCFCSYGSVVKSIIPPGFNTKTDEYILPVELDAVDLLLHIPERSEELYRYLCGRGKTCISELPFEEPLKLLAPLVKTGLVRRTYEVKSKINEKNERYVRLLISENEAEMYLSGQMKLPSDKSGRVVELLVQNPIVSVQELTEYASCSAAVLKTLEKHNIIQIYTKRAERIPYRKYEPADMPVLSDEQEHAFNEIKRLMDSGEPKCALLYGVTGSGKTKVIIKAVRKTLDEGKQAIVLVPEIGLASQAVELFMSHFGARVAIIHSALSAGERIDAYRRIADGDADVVIGTRSAIFAPCDNLGLIAIDEEQEHTYISEMTPKYNAAEVAKFRSAKHKALLVLCSATPSVESYYKATKGIYSLVTLKERYGKAILPEVYFSDLTQEPPQLPDCMLGTRLRAEIKKNLENGEQTILFLNRRGYNTAVVCRKCGEAAYCPNCSVPLSIHISGKVKIQTCHYCGYTRPADIKCSACGSTAIACTGYGTQKLEEELTELFPGAKKIRMDGDTTVVRGSHDDIYTRFKNGEADILYGTQMITKGLDFPSVTLVGIILADSMLYQTDFRSCERTFSMLTQVIGRAGRAEKAGRAIVQTYSPSHSALQLAKAQDYEKFFNEDIILRKAVLFPPFCDMLLIRICGVDEKNTADAAVLLAEKITENHSTQCPDQPLKLFGPFEDSLYRLNNLFRRRIVLKFKNNSTMRAMLFKTIDESNAEHKNINIHTSVDINPPII